MSEKKVIVVGASSNRERYSNMALRELVASGYRAVPVNPAGGAIEGLDAVTSLAELEPPAACVTMYVSSAHSQHMGADLVRLNPGRVIFNPGSENPELMRELERQGIRVQTACTLVLLRSGQFDV